MSFNFLRAVARSIKTTNITAKAAWDGLSETAEKAGKSIRGGVEAIKPMAGQAFKHVVVGGQTAGLAIAPYASKANQAILAGAKSAGDALTPIGRDSAMHIFTAGVSASKAASNGAKATGQALAPIAKKAAEEMRPYAKDPVVIGLGVTVVSIALLPILTPLLNAVSFGARGVVASSATADIQAGIGTVAGVSSQALAPIGKKVVRDIMAYAKNPVLIGSGLTAVAAGIALLAAPILAPPLLGVVGFGAKGVVAGSAAAGMQASIGSVATGSLFAGAQSVAMGGALPLIGYIGAAGVGATSMGITYLTMLF